MIIVPMQEGSLEGYDPITLPYEVYFIKSVVSKKLEKLEADRVIGEYKVSIVP